MRRISKAQARAQRGAAAVEFAVILPLFVMMALGTWELGNALTVSTKITAAIREGGRLASMDFQEIVPAGQSANQKVIQDIKSFLTASGIPGNKVTVTITHAEGTNEGDEFDLEDTANYLQLFRITAEVLYSDLSSFPLERMNGKTVRASLSFRMGRVRSTS